MVVKVKGLEESIFYYGKGMQERCLQSSKTFIDYVGRTYGESEKQSILNNEMVITGARQPKQLATKTEFEELPYYEQELWKREMDTWMKTKSRVADNLSKAYSVLWSLCHSGLQQKIKGDNDYTSLVQGDAGDLYRLVNKICHGNSSTENPFTNLLEGWYNLFFIKGESYSSLSEYLEAFDKKYQVIEACGGSHTSPKFQDIYMNELTARDLEDSRIYKKLRAWQKEEEWKSTDKGQKPPRAAQDEAVSMLIEQYKVYIFIKRSGTQFEDYRTELHNGYNDKSKAYPFTLVDAHHIMDHRKSHPIVDHKKNSDSTKDSSKAKNFLQENFHPVHDPATSPGGEQEQRKTTDPPTGWTFRKGIDCFRCGREGHLTKECWFTEKEDGSQLNDRDHINKCYDEKNKERRRQRQSSQNTNGSTNFIESSTIPTVNEFLQLQQDDSDKLDSHTVSGNSHTLYDTKNSCVTVDVREHHHAYNLSSNEHNRSKEILFDSCSTCDIFINRHFLWDVRPCDWTLVLETQNGTCKVTMIGDLPGVGTVWYYPEGSANILSAHRMITRSGWSVDFSTEQFFKTYQLKDLAYRCVTLEGKHIAFTPTKQGLYKLNCSELFVDTATGQTVCVFGTKKTDNGTHFGRAMCDTRDCNVHHKRECHNNALGSESQPIDSVEESKKRFTKRDQIRANLVRRFQHVAGHPSDATISYSAATNAIKNSPITRRDVKLAMDMLGTSKYAIEGKTTRTQPAAVDQEIIQVPPTIMEYYKNVVLSIDVLHVNKIPFLMSISKDIHYGTVDALDDMKIPTLEKTINKIFRLYRLRGFNVVTIHVDIQFKSIRDRKILTVHVNVVSRGEHVPEAERFIRVIKERARCYYAMLPYGRLPRMMVIHMLKTVVFYINAFVWRQGVSQFLPPVTIIEGIALDFNLHFPLIYGEYVHTYEGTDNSMNKRTVGSVALKPSGNLQGGVRCYSLLTGRILHRTMPDITPLKMPQNAIRRINYIAKKQKAEQGLIFANRNGIIDHDATITGVEEQQQRQQQQQQQQHQHQEDATDIPPYDIDFVHINDDDEHNEDADINITGVQDDSDNDVDEPDNESETNNSVAPENRADEVQPPNEEEGEDSDSADEPEEITRTRSGRVSKPYDYENSFPELYSENHLVRTSPNGKQLRPYYYDDDLKQKLGKGVFISEAFYSENIQMETKITPNRDRIECLEQEEYQLYTEALQYFEYSQPEIEALVYKAKTMSVKQGIEQHGKEGKASAMKEITNLVENDCFGETDYNKLSQSMKDKALPILMFMVLKRNGLLKTRGVADGSVQRLFTNKDDVSSPTPDFYAFKYICAVIAREGRDAATVDLPGFFLQTEQEGDELILLKLTGEVALLLVECEPDKWKKHLQKENGKWTIYVECKKAIYGTMNAALLAYKKLAKLFKRWDMIMNPYDPCVWNKEINGSQFTVVFHIDDLLMSHKSPLVVTDFISELTKEYGSRDDLTVLRGKVHEYLGMTVDFTVEGECTFTQYDYLKKLLKDLPNGLATKYRHTPAPDYLFKINNESSLLDRKRSEQYHNMVAKILWLSQRSRPDIQLATGFHCTRVKEPTEHDWLKLGQLMGYLSYTRYLPLVISITSDGATIFIDGAHAVHMDAKGHSGLFATQGKGAMINVSKKLGVVTTSSTETEIVSTGERLPKCTWFRYFRLAQGEEESEDILMQDNKSAIVLQKNYPYSSRKGSKHIHVRYFFAVDKINNRELKIIYCPTEKMVADYNSKPLQGKLFEELRNKIMGIDLNDYDMYKDKYLAVLKQYDLMDSAEDDIASI